MLNGGNHLRIWVPTHVHPWLVIWLCLELTCTISVTAARLQPPDRQQTEVLFVSFLDPDLPDISWLIEEAQTQIRSFVGNGVVGWRVTDLREVGRILGRQAARLLNGERPTDVTVETGEFQRGVFDRHQRHRWNISTARLPPGSSILNWEASPSEIYRWKLLSLLALVMFEFVLIFLLLQSQRHRRIAQEALCQQKAQLLEAYRLARLGSWTWRPGNDAVTMSNELCDLFGLDAGQDIRSFQQLSGFFTDNSWGRLTQCTERARLGEPFEAEVEGVRLDGSRIWLTVRGEPVCSAKGRTTLLRGTMQDVTERKKAEEARLKHSAVVQSSDDAIISKDLNGMIMSWNAAAERMFGFSEAEAVGKPIMIVIPPELREEEDMILRRVRAGERIEHYETVRISKTGKRVNVSVTISPVRDSTGQVVGSSKIARDITQRTQAEEQLRKSEEKFSKVFRLGPMAISLTSAETHRYIDVNETFERVTGYRRDELIGRTANEVGIWTDPNERRELAKRLGSQGHVRDVEFEFCTKDGSLRTALASAELIEIEREPCILAVCEDITDRKHTEQALLESQKRFRLMSDSAPVLMWLSGPDKLCTDFNQGWLTFTGRTLEQELGEGWAQGVHPDDLQACLDAYCRAFDGRQSFAMEYRLRRHDGQYRWVLDRGVPRFLGNGDFAGYIGCCVDITDEKEAKASQKEFSSRLIRAQEEERARLARELHDDINQRLALLANGLQQLAQNSGKPLRAERNELRDLWRLTSEVANDIQHLSHQLHPSKLHYLGLGAAVRDLCQEFSKQHKVEVECTVRDLPKSLDENVSLSLFRTIQESLRNVAKHSRAHHVKVELNHELNLIRLHVSDDGVGFDPDQVSRNSGLGLVSMQEHLTAAGGRLSVWSRPSCGTRIEGTVPLAARARIA